jgi:argininosuccinate synthase
MPFINAKGARTSVFRERSGWMSDIKRVVLAFSGGLDTSVILKWLQQTYACEVVTFTADLGQGEELGPARAKAELMGVKPEHIFIDDLKEEFVKDYVFPMMRANALYEGLYLLGTSIARPLIAKRQIEIAKMVGADAVSHGATGKGNDQVRFELGYYGLNPDIKVIAPWREWDLTSRTRLIEFAEAHQIPVSKDKRGEAPFSTDANLLHTSSEGKVLEDPWEEVPDYVFSRTVNPEDAPDTPEYITVEFDAGDAVAINGEALSPANLLAKLNDYGRTHGIGRLDLVENRFVGMKSRGMYETPAAPSSTPPTAPSSSSPSTAAPPTSRTNSARAMPSSSTTASGSAPSARCSRPPSITASKRSAAPSGSSSTRARHGSSAASRRTRSIPKRSSPSKTTPAPTTSATPKASSS